MSEVAETVAALAQSILDGDEEAAAEIARKGLGEGIDPLKLVLDGGTPAMREIGDRFGRFECYLPELMLSADAMNAAMEVLIAAMEKAGSGYQSSGKVLLGTVEGDIHDIGKNLIAALLSANGFQVVDAGVDVPAKEFANLAKENNPQIIALSALMSTSAYYQQQVIDFLTETGVRDRYFVVIGGGPVTPEWGTEIGADGYGRTGVDAVRLCTELIGIGDRASLSKIVVIK